MSFAEAVDHSISSRAVNIATGVPSNAGDIIFVFKTQNDGPIACGIVHDQQTMVGSGQKVALADDQDRTDGMLQLEMLLADQWISLSHIGFLLDSQHGFLAANFFL